ncbi:MAG: redoxin family protein [Myxococcota bacterium]
MNWKVAWIPAVPVLLLVLVLAAGFGVDPHALPSMLDGKPAPPFSLISMTGESFDSAVLRGKPVVLNFWATWCEPCKVEHEILQQASRYYGSDVQFVGIIYQDTPEAAAEYLASRSNVFTQLLDPDSKVAINYGVAGVPESFFIDGAGRIHTKQAGAVSPALLRDEVSKLLGASEQGGVR